MRPLVKVIPSGLYLTTLQLPLQQIKQLQKTIIPSLEFVGISSQRLSLDELKKAASELRIKNPVIGHNDKYEYKGKPLTIQFVQYDDLKLIETTISVIVDYPSKGYSNKLLEQTMDQELDKCKMLCNGNLVIDQVDKAELLNSTDFKFIVPILRLADDSDLRYQGKIPISFYIPNIEISKQDIIDIMLIELVASLKIILSQKFPYRKVQVYNCLIVQDYSRTNQFQTNKMIQLSQKAQTKARKSVGLLLFSLLSVFIFYLAYKMI